MLQAHCNHIQDRSRENLIHRIIKLLSVLFYSEVIHSEWKLGKLVTVVAVVHASDSNMLQGSLKPYGGNMRLAGG